VRQLARDGEADDAGPDHHALHVVRHASFRFVPKPSLEVARAPR
jgi:hypothetical protein